MRMVDPVSSREALTGTEDLGFRGGRDADNVDPIFTANDKIARTIYSRGHTLAQEGCRCQWDKGI